MSSSTSRLVLGVLGLAGSIAAAQNAQAFSFIPGDLVVSGSTYVGTASTVTIGQALPGGGNAVANGLFPDVFYNNTNVGGKTVDASFGVASPLFLYQYSIGAPAAPGISAAGVYNVTANTGVATSFPSKSEGALNLSPDGRTLSLVDYLTTPNTLDVSNSNTPGIVEPGNYTANPTARAVVTLDANAKATVLPTNAYPGNNGRAAIDVNGTYYLAGNAGNANGSPQVTAATGIQTFNPATASQTNGAYNTSSAGSFNVTQVGLPADKAAKDNNYRGMTIFNNTLYATKGSGSNGIDTVYQVGTAGTLPTAANKLISVLPGFPTDPAKTNPANFYPFGLFFANAKTLYVADEGSQTSNSKNVGGILSAADKLTAATDANAGLEKWVLESDGLWHNVYTLQAGLGLGIQYSITDLPTNLDPATDGLRNITGELNAGGTVSIFAITSTISTSGDQGSDSNRLVEITDNIDALSAPAGESFTTLETAGYGQVLRGVSFAPVPEPSAFGVLGVGLATLGLIRRKRG